MKKMVLFAAALAMMSGSAFAADMPVKATRRRRRHAFDPWDIAFGSAIMNDYIFRGVTQSNHKPSVAAYFEPRYNVNKDLQLYIGTSFESISFANRAAAEVDIYGGIRPTFGMFAFDFGVWGYLYPGGHLRRQCASFGAFPGGDVCSDQPGHDLPRQRQRHEEGRQLLRRLRQGQLHHQRQLGVRRQRILFAELPELRRLGQLRFDHRQVHRAEHACFGTSGVGMYVSGEFGRQWLGTSDAFYGVTAFPTGIKYADYNTWNIGIGFTYKVFTLDLRYSDTDLSKGNCNAFTSDLRPRSLTQLHPDQSVAASAPTGAARPASPSSRLT